MIYLNDECILTDSRIQMNGAMRASQVAVQTLKLQQQVGVIGNLLAEYNARITALRIFFLIPHWSLIADRPWLRPRQDPGLCSWGHLVVSGH